MNENTQKKIIALCGSQSELARRLGKKFANGISVVPLSGGQH